LLLPYQQKPGQAASFVEHIKLGVQVIALLLHFHADNFRKRLKRKAKTKDFS
jgi:hypothetical protein